MPDVRERAIAALGYALNAAASARRGHLVTAVDSLLLQSAADQEQRIDPYLKTHRQEHEQLVEEIGELRATNEQLTRARLKHDGHLDLLVAAVQHLINGLPQAASDALDELEEARRA